MISSSLRPGRLSQVASSRLWALAHFCWMVWARMPGEQMDQNQSQPKRSKRMRMNTLFWSIQQGWTKSDNNLSFFLVRSRTSLLSLDRLASTHLRQHLEPKWSVWPRWYYSCLFDRRSWVWGQTLRGATRYSGTGSFWTGCWLQRQKDIYMKFVKMNETKPIALPELTIFRYFGWKCPHGDFWMIHDIQYIENWIHILSTLQLCSRFSGVAEQALGKACLENEVKCKQVLQGKETCNSSNSVEHGRKHDKMSTWQLTIHYCLVSREVKGDLEAMLLVAGVCQWLARSRACQL